MEDKLKNLQREIRFEMLRTIETDKPYFRVTYCVISGFGRFKTRNKIIDNTGQKSIKKIWKEIEEMNRKVFWDDKLFLGIMTEKYSLSFWIKWAEENGIEFKKDLIELG